MHLSKKLSGSSRPHRKHDFADSASMSTSGGLGERGELGVEAELCELRNKAFRPHVL
jgi:hypothetical protein